MTALVDNRKAHFNYEILEKFEAGIELLGLEAKSVKSGRAILAGSFVIIRGGEAYIVGMQIPPYQVNNTPLDYDPLRTRKLLLNRKEIQKLANVDQKGGLTIVPLSLYNKGAKIKLEIAVARGKKEYNKREVIKKRDLERETRREYSDR
jgi:SsrA-binding protein